MGSVWYVGPLSRTLCWYNHPGAVVHLLYCIAIKVRSQRRFLAEDCSRCWSYFPRPADPHQGMCSVAFSSAAFSSIYCSTTACVCMDWGQRVCSLEGDIVFKGASLELSSTRWLRAPWGYEGSLPTLCPILNGFSSAGCFPQAILLWWGALWPGVPPWALHHEIVPCVIPWSGRPHIAPLQVLLSISPILYNLLLLSLSPISHPSQPIIIKSVPIFGWHNHWDPTLSWQIWQFVPSIKINGKQIVPSSGCPLIRVSSPGCCLIRVFLIRSSPRCLIIRIFPPSSMAL